MVWTCQNVQDIPVDLNDPPDFSAIGCVLQVQPDALSDFERVLLFFFSQFLGND
jgi:hypothetical protein